MAAGRRWGDGLGQLRLHPLGGLAAGRRWGWGLRQGQLSPKGGLQPWEQVGAGTGGWDAGTCVPKGDYSDGKRSALGGGGGGGGAGTVATS